MPEESASDIIRLLWYPAGLNIYRQDYLKVFKTASIRVTATGAC